MGVGLQIGQLRDPVRIERRTATQDSAGAEVYEWEPIARRMALIAHMSGREYVAAGNIRGEVSVKITMRWPVDVIPEDRIIKAADGTIYGVLAVLPVGNAKRAVEIMCRIGVDDGR